MKNYRPLCLLSHTRKTIDSAILMKTNEKFTHTRSQFRFQSSISFKQALITVDHNARRGLSHMAVLDLEKAYDRVDRRKLLQVAGKWLPSDLLNMVRCLLGPLTIHSKGDRTNLHVTMTRGVPQGAPSSPIHPHSSTCTLTT